MNLDHIESPTIMVMATEGATIQMHPEYPSGPYPSPDIEIRIDMTGKTAAHIDVMAETLKQMAEALPAKYAEYERACAARVQAIDGTLTSLFEVLRDADLLPEENKRVRDLFGRLDLGYGEVPA